MKIDRIEIFHVAMPLIYPWKTAYGEDAEIHSVLCRMDSGGISAWGEAAPLAAPCYSSEWGGGVFEVVKQWLAPTIIGQTLNSGIELQDALSTYKGNPFAKAVLDNTWWSLQSAIENKSLQELIGGSRACVPVGADFGIMDSIDDLLCSIQGAVAQNFRRIKLKYRPGWDEPMLKAVRENFPDTVFHIDCNSGYRIKDHQRFQRLDAYNLAMIEQPLNHDDLLDHSELAKQIKTPICLDESISSKALAAQAIALRACGYINIKPGRVGGLTNAIAIHDLCQVDEIPCWVGGMLESATGSAICAALATLPNFLYPADIFPSERYYRCDLSDDPITLARDEQGKPAIHPPATIPSPNLNRLKQWTIQSALFRA